MCSRSPSRGAVVHRIGLTSISSSATSDLGSWPNLAPRTQSKMFGKTAMYDIIRENAGASARDILDAVISGLNHFKQGTQAQDDETLVVIKTIDIEKGEQ